MATKRERNYPFEIIKQFVEAYDIKNADNIKAAMDEWYQRLKNAFFFVGYRPSADRRVGKTGPNLSITKYRHLAT
jgi:hypothetical protein